MTFGGHGSPVITDGPFPESKEFLAGYWMVDVESEERALEIAAKASAAQGPVAGRSRSRSRFARSVSRRSEPALSEGPVAPGVRQGLFAGCDVRSADELDPAR